MQYYVMHVNSGTTESSLAGSDGLDKLASLIEIREISIEKAKLDLKKCADNIVFKNYPLSLIS